MRLPLQQVTLVAIDTRAPALAAQSLQRSMTQVEFARTLLFGCNWQVSARLPQIEYVEIAPIRSGAEYSEFVLRRLAPYIESSHVLVTQWDGFVVDATAWRDEFLQHDYIGAVWPDQASGRNVGNGGFSLRSRRLLAAGSDPRITELHPEDEVLCRRYRELLEHEYGLRFAPAELARQFAFENESPRAATFGFHGPVNLPRFLDEPTIAAALDALPDEFFRSRDARRLARALLFRSMPATAQSLLQRRRAAGRNEPASRLLSAASSLLLRWHAARGS